MEHIFSNDSKKSDNIEKKENKMRRILWEYTPPAAKTFIDCLIQQGADRDSDFSKLVAIWNELAQRYLTFTSATHVAVQELDASFAAIKDGEFDIKNRSPFSDDNFLKKSADVYYDSTKGKSTLVIKKGIFMKKNIEKKLEEKHEFDQSSLQFVVPQFQEKEKHKFDQLLLLFGEIEFPEK